MLRARRKPMPTGTSALPQKSPETEANQVDLTNINDDFDHIVSENPRSREAELQTNHSIQGDRPRVNTSVVEDAAVDDEAVVVHAERSILIREG